MWISVDIGILEHPKMMRTAKELGVSRVACLGHLVSLWIFCYKSAPDGDLSHYDPQDIAIAAEWDGDAHKFYDTLVMRGWIDVDGDTVVAHDWYEHAGKYLWRNKQSSASQKLMRQQSHTIDTPSQVQTDKTDKPTKTVYGELQNVRLTSEERDKLTEKFGVDGASTRVEKLSAYIASSGRQYKSHYATILNWEHGDTAKAKPTLPVAQSRPSLQTVKCELRNE